MVVALLLTLGLSGLLALNAAITTRDRRASAERVLRDYAALAADQFAARLETRISNQVYPIHALMARAGTGAAAAVESRDALAPLLGEVPRAVLGSALLLFRIDPATRTIAVAGNATPDAARLVLRDSVLAHAGRKLDRDAYVAIARITTTPPVLAIYGVVRDSSGAVLRLHGFTVPDSALLRPIRAALGPGPLLPRSLVHDARADSVVGIEVAAGGPPILSRHFDRASPFTASRSLGKSTDLLEVRTSLSERLAPSLIVGGLPRSQVPLLVALLAVASLLVVTAALQLRRERAFASLREDFVSGVSHELRTPLAQIRLFSETLRLGRVRNDAEAARSIAIIDQEARRLGHLVDNLLHFSRAERGAVRIVPERTDLGRLIADIVAHFQPIADARHVTIATSLAPGIDVDVDPNAVRQIVLNLLDNALKYGPDGQVVTVSSARDADMVAVAVSDQGPGIPADARERIWERFWRDARARSSAVAGTGIGLAIVRELVTLHGGTCAATDAPGGGARVEVRVRS